MLIRDLITGSVVPVAVRRAISTPSFRLRVWSSVKVIGLVFEEGEDDEEREDEGEGEDEEEGDEEEGEGEEDEGEGEEEGEGEDDEEDEVNPSTAGSTILACFCRKRRFCPISSTSRTFSCGGLYVFTPKNRSSDLTV